MAPRRSKRNVHNSSALHENNTFELVDRISALPDSILSAILSCLPTKDAVSTSTLSKRWKFMWRTVYNLDFCLQYHSLLVKQKVNDKTFVDFVNHVLLRLDGGVLNMFHLVREGNCIDSYVTSWIKFAITRNVHNISLNLEPDYVPYAMMMPFSAFSSDTLRSLKLGGSICISTASVFRFPSLESLHLYGVILSQEALEDIIRGCPVLKYLKLHIDPGGDDNEFTLVISSTSLLRFELKLGCVRTHLKVDASSLEHLKIFNNEYVYMNFVQNNFSSLVEADLSFYMDCDDKYNPEADISNAKSNAVRALDCVKILTLCEVVIRGFSFTAKSSSAKFTRLVKLEASVTSNCWSSLQDLIQLSNNLEALTIHKIPLGDGTEIDHSYWTTTAAEVPRCLSNSLKDVCYDDYNGLEDEREMICYMLKYGSVLEDMHILISCDLSDGEKLKLVRDICEFPRKSPVCKVRFSVQPSN